jgi:hypothetical protein
MVRTENRDVERSIIPGADIDIHIFVFSIINFL